MLETIEVGKVYCGKKAGAPRTVEGVRFMGAVYAGGPKIWSPMNGYVYDIHYRRESGSHGCCSVATFLAWAKCEVPS